MPGTTSRRKRPKKLKGPRCWVDDVTVSSGSSVKGGCDRPPETESTLAMNDLSGMKRCESNDVENFEMDMGNKRTDYIKNFTYLNLPSFVCPSSGKKSQQIAVKEWLIKHNFLCANRNVPLL